MNTSTRAKHGPATSRREKWGVLSFNAVLELDRDVAPPHDNFTLSLHIVEDDYKRRVATEPGIIRPMNQHVRRCLQRT